MLGSLAELGSMSFQTGHGEEPEGEEGRVERRQGNDKN